jgi:hypothetical protein
MKNLNSDSDNANGKNGKSGPENIGEAINKTTSPEQIAANRDNARKSTGPKTPEGRAISKMNALKHGIFSKEVLVRGLNIKESRRELEVLHERFWQEYQPLGAMEELLLDQIVTAYWRLRRAWTAESGEIALSVDEGQWKRSHPPLELQVLLWGHSADPVQAMQDTAIGNRTLQHWLSEVRTSVAKEGELKDADIKKFVFRDKPSTISKELERRRVRLVENAKGADEATRREENKKQTLQYIDRELCQLKWQQEQCRKREESEEQSRQAAAVLPAPDVLDKILRYETKLERQMYRAMNQLERVQRMRRGESVPPPLTMEVSERV